MNSSPQLSLWSFVLRLQSIHSHLYAELQRCTPLFILTQTSNLCWSCTQRQKHSLASAGSSQHDGGCFSDWKEEFRKNDKCPFIATYLKELITYGHWSGIFSLGCSVKKLSGSLQAAYLTFSVHLSHSGGAALTRAESCRSSLRQQTPFIWTKGHQRSSILHSVWTALELLFHHSKSLQHKKENCSLWENDIELIHISDFIPGIDLVVELFCWKLKLYPFFCLNLSLKCKTHILNKNWGKKHGFIMVRNQATDIFKLFCFSQTSRSESSVTFALVTHPPQTVAGQKLQRFSVSLR